MRMQPQVHSCNLNAYQVDDLALFIDPFDGCSRCDCGSADPIGTLGMWRLATLAFVSKLC